MSDCPDKWRGQRASPAVIHQKRYLGGGQVQRQWHADDDHTLLL